LGGSPKILARDYKIEHTRSIVQNFATIGRRSSEITRREKKETTAKQKSFRKLSFSGGLIRPVQTV